MRHASRAGLAVLGVPGRADCCLRDVAGGHAADADVRLKRGLRRGRRRPPKAPPPARRAPVEGRCPVGGLGCRSQRRGCALRPSPGGATSGQQARLGLGALGDRRRGHGGDVGRAEARQLEALAQIVQRRARAVGVEHPPHRARSPDARGEGRNASGRGWSRRRDAGSCRAPRRLRGEGRNASGRGWSRRRDAGSRRAPRRLLRRSRRGGRGRGRIRGRGWSRDWTSCSSAPAHRPPWRPRRRLRGQSRRRTPSGRGGRQLQTLPAARPAPSTCCSRPLHSLGGPSGAGARTPRARRPSRR